jgi:hypothetical protein
VYYKTFDVDKKGNPTSRDDNHTIELKEKNLGGSKDVGLCGGSQTCKATPKDGGVLVDTWRVFKGASYDVEKRFTIDGKAAQVYDSGSKKNFDYVVVHSSYEKGFSVDYLNNQR